MVCGDAKALSARSSTTSSDGIGSKPVQASWSACGVMQTIGFSAGTVRITVEPATADAAEVLAVVKA